MDITFLLDLAKEATRKYWQEERSDARLFYLGRLNALAEVIAELLDETPCSIMTMLNSEYKGNRQHLITTN